MTNEELDALQGLCEAATKGPWIVERLGRYEDHDEVYINLSDDEMEIEDWRVTGTSYENADFIAAARTALPALIAEVRRLTERCEAAEKDLHDIAQEMFSDDSENLRGNWYPCDVCANAKFDESGTECWECFAAAYNNDTTAFKWRGPSPSNH